MKKIVYTEPKDYFPKEIKDKYFPKKKKTVKKEAVPEKKTGGNKKK